MNRCFTKCYDGLVLFDIVSLLMLIYVPIYVWLLFRINTFPTFMTHGKEMQAKKLEKLIIYDDSWVRGPKAMTSRRSAPAFSAILKQPF